MAHCTICDKDVAPGDLISERDAEKTLYFCSHEHLQVWRRKKNSPEEPEPVVEEEPVKPEAAAEAPDQPAPTPAKRGRPRKTAAKR